MIPFIDLQAQRKHLGTKIDDAIARVLDHGKFIMGPEVRRLEEQLSAFCSAQHCVSCASGTDALLLPLMAWGIGPGDAVFVPSFTFASTAEMVALAGATPIFVDVLSDTYNMDPQHLETAIAQVSAKHSNLTAKAVVAVDLFGQIADYPKLREICNNHGLKLIADAAQGLGSTLRGKQAGAWADVVTTSFFPAKPLGCYGDGGAVLTNDKALADIMVSLRVHGKGSDKYDNVRIGINGRLDTLQAAIVIEKLAIFPSEIEARNSIADRYYNALHNLVTAPYVPDGVVSTWAQYTVQVDNRDAVQAALKDNGIPTMVYYPKPLHLQTAYKEFPVAGETLPVSESLSQSVLSLPMHPYLDEASQTRVIESLRRAVS